MDEPIQTIEHRGHIIKVFHDDLVESPRSQFDHLGTMVAFHSRYDLGDQDHGLTKDEAIELWELSGKDDFILPLYLYDHSGISMSASRTYPFDCPWDSSHVGFIFVTKAKVRKEWGVKRISAKLREKVFAVLQGEVKEYDYYLRGEVYGYDITKDGEDVDSCWGFYGDPDEHMIPQAKKIAEDETNEQEGLIYDAAGNG